MLASDAHTQQNPASDHEPRTGAGGIGVVTALDITHDPDHGINSETLAEALRAAKDGRIKYIISNRKIASGAGEAPGPAWQWRPYNGKNPHNHHCHISVKVDPAAYDSVAPWTINMTIQSGAANAPVTVAPDPVLHRGDSGNDVKRFQTLLRANGAVIDPNGIFDDETFKILKTFQTANNLVPDGVCGRQTWEALKV